MNGNNITGIDTLLFESGMKINGSINTSGGDVNLENGSIHNVYSIDGGGDPVNFFDPVDMNGNPLLDSDGNLEIQGEVYLPTGDLDMAGNDIVNPANVDGVDLDDPGNGIAVLDSRYQIIEDAVGDSELNNSQEFTADGIVLTSNLNMTGNDIETGGGDIAVVDTANSQDIARFKQSGEFQVPNGNLDVNTNQITGVSTIQADVSNPTLDTAGGGSDQWIVYDDANSQAITRFNEGGNVEIPKGNLKMNGNNIVTNDETDMELKGEREVNIRSNTDSDGSGSLNLYSGGTKGIQVTASGGNVNIPNGNLNIGLPSNEGKKLDVAGGVNTEGNLNMNQNKVQTVDVINGTPNEPLELTVSETGGSELVLDNSGDVRVQNGNLDLRGNSLVDTTSSNTVYIGDGNDDTVVMDAPGNVEFEGDLDLSSDSIINYYDSACPQGKTIADIQDDGSFQCVDIAEEVTDVYVNRSGDTMTGDLNMLGNQVKNVSRLGAGTANPQENLDVDGTASIENSGTRMEVDSTGDVVVTLGP
ncbi:MAG: hypothetical protein BRC28_01965 [Nanohaloarchaea archaeon SW_4_43_9]|nr:MAG: hypothetical protein BRC28_01965 [Nanohaloarchaea archaeon SW_4_43_9]